MDARAVWQRAILLYNQQRWQLAERELRTLLALEPHDAEAHALLAVVLAQTERLDEALELAREAVTIDPGYDGGFRAIASVHMARNELDAAVEASRRAIDIDPADPDHFGLLAQIRLRQQRWPDALAAADEGLRLDPTDTDCLNMRSFALAKLGRADEANATVEASLARDPDNPYTHQAQGFALLQQGDADRAVRHFQEALRRDPTLDGARAGLVEAIKTKNPLYRWVLAPFVWMERFPPARRTQLLVGVWLAAQVGRRALDGAGYEAAAEAVGMSWLAIVLVTACIVPLFNLLLLLHPVGRHALDRWSKGHALLLGGALLVALGLFVGDALADSSLLRWARWFGLAYLLPIAGLGMFAGGWPRKVMLALCGGLLAAAIWWAVRWQLVISQLFALEATPATAAREAAAAPLIAEADGLKDLFGSLLLAAALSTWFILLAPKGRRARRHG